MGTTRNGYPYPEYSDPWRTPDDIAALAHATDNGITEVKTRLDQSLAMTHATQIKMPSGWRARSDLHYRVMGPFIMLSGYFSRDTNLSATSYQNAFTLPAEIWPDVETFVTVPARSTSTSSSRNGYANLHIKTNGTVDFYLAQETDYIYVQGLLLPRALR